MIGCVNNVQDRVVVARCVHRTRNYARGRLLIRCGGTDGKKGKKIWRMIGALMEDKKGLGILLTVSTTSLVQSIGKVCIVI